MGWSWGPCQWRSLRWTLPQGEHQGNEHTPGHTHTHTQWHDNEMLNVQCTGCVSLYPTTTLLRYQLTVYRELEAPSLYVLLVSTLCCCVPAPSWCEVLVPSPFLREWGGQTRQCTRAGEHHPDLGMQHQTLSRTWWALVTRLSYTSGSSWVHRVYSIVN